MSHHAEHAQDKELGRGAVFRLLAGLAELSVGLTFGSPALIADGVHSASDSYTQIISWGAEKLSKKKPTERYTFGFHRAATLAALINTITLYATAFFIARLSWNGLHSGDRAAGEIIVVAAALAAVANVVNYLLIEPKSNRENLNKKSVARHLLVDIGISVSAIVAGIFVTLGFEIADSIAGLVLAFFIAVLTSVELLPKVVGRLMGRSPDGVDAKVVAAHLSLELKQMRVNIFASDAVKVHDVHIWSEGEIRYMDAHIVIGGMWMSAADRIRIALDRCAREHFGFDHVTLQVEANHCGIF